MSRLQAPLLEMNFYLEDILSDGFVAIFNALVELKAIHDGTVDVLRGAGIREKPFTGGPTSAETITIAAEDVDSLSEISDIRPVRTTFRNASGLRKNGEELGYGRISEIVAEFDHPPVTITTSGAIFDPIPEYEKPARQAAKNVYRQFIQIIDKVRPSYAAITFEYTMECPTQLKKDPRSIAFSTFYINTDYLGSQAIERIRSAYSRAYIDDIANGIYVSSGGFNPKGRMADRHWLPNEEQVLVAKLIGQKAK